MAFEILGVISGIANPRAFDIFGGTGKGGYRGRVPLFLLASLIFLMTQGLSAFSGTLCYDTDNSLLPGNFAARLIPLEGEGFIAALDGGASIWKGREFSSVELPSKAKEADLSGAAVFRDVLYLSSRSHGLLVRKGNSWEILNRAEGSFPAQCVNGLALIQVPGGPAGPGHYLYAATSTGLVGYDPLSGKASVVEAIPQTPVRCVAASGSQIWAGTSEGAFCFVHGSSGPAARLDVQSGLPAAGINAITFSDNRVWLATDGGLARIFKEETRVYDSTNSPMRSSVVVDAQPVHAGVVFSTATDVHMISRETFKTFELQDRGASLAGASKFRPISSALLLADRDPGEEELWVSTLGSGLLRHGKAIVSQVVSRTRENLFVESPGDRPSVSYSDADGLASSIINDIAVDNSSFLGGKAVWIATDKGVCVFDGKLFRTFDTGNSGLPDDSVTVIKVDGPPGYRYLWAGTRSGGIARFDGKAWQVFNRAEGLPADTIFDLEVSERGVWAATNSGVVRFDWKSWTHYTRENGLVNERAYDIALDGSAGIWITTELGISRFDGGRFTSYSQWDGLPGFRFTRALSAGDRDLWIGSYRNGVIRFDGRNFSEYGRREGLSSMRVNDLALSGGRLYAACQDGLFAFEEGRFRQVETNFKGNPRCLDPDGAYLWVGTTEGLHRILAK